MPLISVVVVTYNSSKYVLETLESIKEQNYKGSIELIISDDSSSDNTIELCERWLKSYHQRFIDSKIIKTPRNLGICGNYNFALKNLSGEWVKYIAGDDILLPNALSTYMFAAETTNDKAFCGAVITFNNNHLLDIHESKYGYRFLAENILDSNDPNIQHYNLLFTHGYGTVEGPSLFIHTDSLRKMGGMDERFPMLEDMTFALNWTKNGNHLGVIKEPLVKYREYTESVSKKFKETYFQKMTYHALYTARYEYYLRKKKWLKCWDWYVMRAILLHDNSTVKDKLIKNLLMMTNIQMYINFIKGMCKK